MSCIFCKIVNKEIPASIVFEDDQVIAFNDIAPQAPIHVLAIPKQHIDSIADLIDDNIAAYLITVLKNIAKDKNLDKTGYRLVVNQGKLGGQAVNHLHFHLLSGRQMNWPPG